MLQADDAAQRAFRRITITLRQERRARGYAHTKLAASLPVRPRAISEWETGVVDPTLEHLILWSRALGYRLVVIGPDGSQRHGLVYQRPSETWDRYECRRLATPLRYRREVCGMRQREVAALVGVSRDSIGRWELGYTPPTPLALILWAHTLGCRVVLQPIPIPRQRELGTGARTTW